MLVNLGLRRTVSASSSLSLLSCLTAATCESHPLALRWRCWAVRYCRTCRAESISCGVMAKTLAMINDVSCCKTADDNLLMLFKWMIWYYKMFCCSQRCHLWQQWTSEWGAMQFLPNRFSSSSLSSVCSFLLFLKRKQHKKIFIVKHASQTRNLKLLLQTK